MRRNEKILSLAVLLVFLASQCQGAKMLAFFPFPGKSHHATFRVIFTELADRGHQIDYYSPFPMNPPHPNVTHFPIRDFTRDLWDGLGGDIKDEGTSLFWKINYHNIMRNVTLEAVCNMKELGILLRSHNEYDLVLHESHFVQEFASVLAHRFNALSVVLMSAGDFSTANEMSGLPDNTAYMVDNKMPFGDRMTFFERLHNTYAATLSIAAYYLDLYRIQSRVDSCFKYPEWETRPSLPMLLADDALVLYNTHHSMGFSYPKAPHVKEIGGVSIVNPKPLPKDLESFMNEAKHGVIYFSLGSVIDMAALFDPKIKDIFANTFSRLKEKVLWKWNGDAWSGMPSNVKLSKWFPQQDVLAHKNVKLFITHGGLISAYETIHNGVPTIITPLFGDQRKNAQRMVDSGFGEQILFDELTEDLLFTTIRKVIDDPKYKQEASRRSELLKDRPMEPVDEAAYWIEYVLKHGRVLQPAAVHLSFIQLHLLDVYAFIIGLVFLVYYTTRKALNLVVSRFFYKKNLATKIKKKLN